MINLLFLLPESCITNRQESRNKSEAADWRKNQEENALSFYVPARLDGGKFWCSVKVNYSW